MNNISNIIKTAAVSAIIAMTATSCLEKYPGSYIPEEDSMKTFTDAEQHNIGIYASLYLDQQQSVRRYLGLGYQAYGL